MRTLKLKLIHLPYALAVVLALLLAVAAAQRGNHNSSAESGQQAEVGTADSSEEPKVTVNGEEVDLGPDGEGTFRSDGATVEVNGNSTNVTSGGGRTVIENEDGSVDIHVESNSTHGSSDTTVRYRGGEDIEWDNDSSVEIKQKGEGSIRYSD